MRIQGQARIAVVLAVVLLAASAVAADYTPAPKRFKACENKAGPGLFWVDSTNGRTWWADPATMQWVYYGAPAGAESGPEGTFIPFENNGGDGLYVLNTATGAGWWTDGKLWKSLGTATPASAAPAVDDAPHHE